MKTKEMMRAGLVGALLMAAAAASVFAQGYGKGPVKIIVTNAPGTAPDVIARVLANGLQKIRGSAFIVENRVGAQGMIGGEATSRAIADGTTLMLASDTLTSVLPLLIEKMSFDPSKDLKPIALVADAGYVLVANPQFKVKTAAELIALAKAKPNAVDYASTGVTSAHNRTMVQFLRAAGIQMNQIPYGAKGPLLDVVAGTVPVMWSGLSGAVPHVQAGKLNALAVSTPARHPSLPNVPTADELGFKGFNEVNWFGIMAPSGISDELAKTIESDVLNVAQTQEFKTRMVDQGMSVHLGTREEFQTLIKADLLKNKTRIFPEPSK